jgi:hypothetical protein
MTRIVPTNKFIRKGVDEGEYADAGITESLRQLRRRVQGTAEKGLGAAGRTGSTPHPDPPPQGGREKERKIRSRPSRMAPVIGLESSGMAAADSKRPASQEVGEVGWYHERGLSSRWTKAFYFSEVP